MKYDAETNALMKLPRYCTCFAILLSYRILLPVLLHYCIILLLYIRQKAGCNPATHRVQGRASSSGELDNRAKQYNADLAMIAPRSSLHAHAFHGCALMFDVLTGTGKMAPPLFRPVIALCAPIALVAFVVHPGAVFRARPPALAETTGWSSMRPGRGIISHSGSGGGGGSIHGTSVSALGGNCGIAKMTQVQTCKYLYCRSNIISMIKQKRFGLCSLCSYFINNVLTFSPTPDWALDANNISINQKL